MKIAIAGASGFVGKHLIAELLKHKDIEIIALSRGEYENTDRVEWRKCDLFSLIQVEKALKGADLAIYLVHSMIPSANLSQGRFWDLDLIIADNFARAAEKNELKQVTYLGGIIPNIAEEKLSRHLKSRKEVEDVFKSYKTPVTTLRAGLVIGHGGSSFNILRKLIKRLPILMLPSWTVTRMQPIDIRDAVQALCEVTLDPSTQDRTFDIGGPDVTSYREMLCLTSRLMGKNPWIFGIQILSPKLSRLWVRLITGVPQALVYPLVESLKHQMVVHQDQQLKLKSSPIGLETSLRDALKEKQLVDIFEPQRSQNSNPVSPDKKVRSVQRFKLPENWSMRKVAYSYMKWLDRKFSFIIIAKMEGLTAHFTLFGKFKLLTLTMSEERSFDDRVLFYITGGLLAKSSKTSRARFEVRKTLGGRYVIAAIHDYVPRLPWAIYKYTQAVVHLLVMKSFGTWLSKQ